MSISCPGSHIMKTINFFVCFRLLLGTFLNNKIICPLQHFQIKNNNKLVIFERDSNLGKIYFLTEKPSACGGACSFLNC